MWSYPTVDLKDMWSYPTVDLHDMGSYPTVDLHDMGSYPTVDLQDVRSYPNVTYNIGIFHPFVSLCLPSSPLVSPYVPYVTSVNDKQDNHSPN